MATPAKSDSTAAEEALVRIDAEEFARLEAEELHKARNLKDEQAEREVVERAWREQQEYASAVAELKKKVGWRESRRARAIAAALLVAAVVLGAFWYNDRLVQDRATKAEALRIAAESLARQEEEKRAEPEPTPAAAAQPAEDLEKKARAEAEAKKAAGEKAMALALRIQAEARRIEALAAKKQAEALAQAEERARAQAAASVKEAPRALPPPGTVFQDCADCPRMVVIAAGEFTMGSPASEAGRGLDEGPQRPGAITRPFALGRSEGTGAEFRRFAGESGYRTEG